jgi:hypothetical protein
MKLIGQAPTPFGLANIFLGKYANNGAPGILLEDAFDCDPIATVSVNLSHRPPEGHVWMKFWSENEELREPMIGTDLFEDTGVRSPTGFVEAELWRIKAAP